MMGPIRNIEELGFDARLDAELEIAMAVQAQLFRSARQILITPMFAMTVDAVEVMYLRGMMNVASVALRACSIRHRSSM